MKNILICMLVIALAVVSCTEDLDTDYTGESEGLLVVDGAITTDTTAHTVYLRRTIDYADTIMPPVAGANVTITDGVNQYTLTESAYGSGVYQTDSMVFGVPNTVYMLLIELENGEVYEGSDRLNTIVPIDSIFVVKEKYLFMPDSMHLVYFIGKEDPAPDQYYRWDLYLNDTLWTDTLENIAFASDEWVNGSDFSGDQAFDVFWLNDEEFQTDTVKVTMKMTSISQKYYDFVTAAMLETAWRGGIFDATPANVPGNMNNGALGYFRASAVSRKSTQYVLSSDSKDR